MTRVDIHKDARDLYRAYLALDRATGETALEKTLAELVKLRASMVNGCAYCVDMHSRDALQLGEEERKLIAVSAWHESHLFSDRERAALAFTDAVTELERVDDAYAVAAEHFDSEQLTALLYTIVTVNGWNRLAITTHMVPGVMAEFHSATLSIITVDGEPGEGPDLHRHPYEEVFVILDGECTFTLGDETVVARAGEVLIAPPNTPHGFKISGQGRSRSVNIHSSPEFKTEWL